MKRILFSRPYITRKEINLVKKVLTSGWITTGPMVMKFQEMIKNYIGCQEVLCLNSATAGLELLLRLYGIGSGDEVITTPYTFAATANVILHVGAKPVFVDILEEDFNINPDKVYDAINEKTKAIISVDFGGNPCDYEKLYRIIDSKSHLFLPKNTFQESMKRPLLIADAAHSFGSVYKGEKVGNLADFTVFSFHAVKNLTTAEGGAVAIKTLNNIPAQAIYQKLKIMSLHGQSKDAFVKEKENTWYYSIVEAGYKYNMTDVQAAIGIAQLEKYDYILKKRREIFNKYNLRFKELKCFIRLPILDTLKTKGNAHLYPLRLKTKELRERFIEFMSDRKIQCNVHFIPLPLHPLYRKLGYKIEDYPIAYKNYLSEISLPIYPHLKKKDFNRIVEETKKFFKRY